MRCMLGLLFAIDDEFVLLASLLGDTLVDRERLTPRLLAIAERLADLVRATGVADPLRDDEPN